MNHIQQYIQAVARANGRESTAVHFNVQPAVSQKMREAVRLASDFLKQINMFTKAEMTGETVGISARLNASRTNTKPNDASKRRNPKPVHSKTKRTYLLSKVNFDSLVTYDELDAWAHQPEYVAKVNAQIVKSKALSLIAIGFNGTREAEDSDFEANPLLQDIKKGWLQQMRESAPENVLGSTSSAVDVGQSAKYKNLDAVVVDALGELIDDEFAEMPDMVAIVNRSLLSDKYFGVVNAAGQTATENIASHAVMATKRLGGIPAVAVPYFPKNTILITPLSNLSIYFHKTGHRRKLADEPEYDRIADYQSENIDYVVEEYGAAALIENIKIADS